MLLFISFAQRSFFKLIPWFSKHDLWENREKPHTNKIVEQESNEGSNKSNQTSQKKNRVTKHFSITVI